MTDANDPLAPLRGRGDGQEWNLGEGIYCSSIFDRWGDISISCPTVEIATSVKIALERALDADALLAARDEEIERLKAENAKKQLAWSQVCAEGAQWRAKEWRLQQRVAELQCEANLREIKVRELEADLRQERARLDFIAAHSGVMLYMRDGFLHFRWWKPAYVNPATEALPPRHPHDVLVEATDPCAGLRDAVDAAMKGES